MTKNMHKEMLHRETVRRLQREKRLLTLQKDALLLLSLGLFAILGMILIAL